MSTIETPSFGIYPCSLCGALAASHSVQMKQFAYPDGGTERLLTAMVPVVTCAACGESYSGPEAEEAEHAAVCRYLGRLTPSEIRDLRDRHGLSQAKLAERTGIGIASIKRWEAGTNIQNPSLDARLREIDNDTAAKSVARPQPRFQTQLTGEMFAAAKQFRLRQPLAIRLP